MAGVTPGAAAQQWNKFVQKHPIMRNKPAADEILFLLVVPAASGAGLCEVSALAWLFLQPSIDSFVTIPDSAALHAMRQPAAGSECDRPLAAGASGAAGLAGLTQLAGDPAHRRNTRLDAHSRILLINTEDATDTRPYRRWVGETAQSVTRRRRYARCLTSKDSYDRQQYPSPGRPRPP
ncbi:MAG: hypothetical protein ACN6QY_16180 [Pseudomonas sp.]|uniref:hypothetical protein n=1 Tax=Pseudomonas sp. TaxID=306 RepID=UPI003D147EDF